MVEWVPDGISYQVLKVFDNVDVSPWVNWKWKDGNLADGGQSPVFGAFMELGLRTFGLNLFGLRVFPCLLAFLSLVIAAWFCLKILRPSFAATFLLLIVTSPWYLVHARSGILAGFTMSLAIITLAAFGLAFTNGSVFWGLCAGTLIGLLPYGYTIVRPLPILMLVAMPLVKPRRWKVILAVATPALLIAALQLVDIHHAKEIYFASRGESILSSHRTPDGHDWGKIGQRFTENLLILGRNLVGFNAWLNPANNKLIRNIWQDDNLLFPVFLVPFFLLGFIVSLTRAVSKRQTKYFLPLFSFVIASIPALGVGIGGLNPSRLLLLVIPVYFFITEGLFATTRAVENLSVSKLPLFRSAWRSICVLVLFAILGYQTWNYFAFEREFPARVDEQAVAAFSSRFLQDHPTERLVIALPGPFNGLHVGIRFFWGESIREVQKQNRLKFYFEKFDQKSVAADGFKQAVVRSEDAPRFGFDAHKGARLVGTQNFLIFSIGGI